MIKSKNTPVMISILSVVVLSGCSQHNNNQSLSVNKLAPISATTQSNSPVSVNIEHNSALSINETLHNFKIISSSHTSAGTYKIAQHFLTYYPKKDFTGKGNTIVVQAHDKNNRLVNFDFNVVVNKNKKPTAEAVTMSAMGNVPVRFSVTDGVTFSTGTTVKNIEVIKNYNPKAGKLVLGPEATFTAADNFSGEVRYDLKLTDSNNNTIVYPLTINVGK